MEECLPKTRKQARRPYRIVQCLGDGDPLTARETGEEMSNESLEMEDEDIERGTRSSTTRSGRKSRRPKESS